MTGTVRAVRKTPVDDQHVGELLLALEDFPSARRVLRPLLQSSRHAVRGSAGLRGMSCLVVQTLRSCTTMSSSSRYFVIAACSFPSRREVKRTIQDLFSGIVEVALCTALADGIDRCQTARPDDGWLHAKPVD